MVFFENTHRQNALANKTQALTSSMDIYTCVISILNQLFIRRSFIPKLNFQKNKVVSDKTPVLLILLVLTLAFERPVLHGNVVFSMVVLPTK